MTRDEFHQYWKPARANLGYVEKRDALDKSYSENLAKLCGAGAYPAAGYWSEIDLTDEMKAKLILLASPHHYALSKAMEARQNDSR